MNEAMQRFLDERFSNAQDFLRSSGQAILEDLVATFEQQLWAHLQAQSLLRLNEKMTIPTRPGLKEPLQDEVCLTWALGYAVGASGFDVGAQVSQQE